jgi:hypothetical protein
MIRRSITRAVRGAVITGILSFWFYNGRKLTADSQVWQASTIFITIDGE